MAESDKPFHIQQAEQIAAYRQAFKDAGHTRTPRVSVSRSIFAIVNDTDRMYFGGDESQDHFGYIEPGKQAVFGRSYAAEPEVLIEQLREDEAIKAADTLLLTIPNQLGVEYNAHLIESVLKHVAPASAGAEAGQAPDKAESTGAPQPRCHPRESGDFRVGSEAPHLDVVQLVRQSCH